MPDHIAGDPSRGHSNPRASDRSSRAEWIGRTLLGVDWGRRRIGLAIKAAGMDFAVPHGVLEPSGPAQAVAALRQAIVASGAQGVVVGVPEHPNPAQAREIRAFCRRVRRPLRGVRWFFVDERLTSEEARDRRRACDGGRRPQDDVAAMLILETFLQSLR